MPYSTIVAALAEQLGGVPEHGARNAFIFSMACNLRYVCNDNPEWIAQILPTYGEARDKAYYTIKSACNRPQTVNMPALLKRALDNARKQNQIETWDDSSLIFGDTPPEMPKELPSCIAHLVSNVPDIYKAAMAMSVFPSLATHLHGVKFRYIDGVEHEPALMNVLMAEQSVGKGCVNLPIDFIMKDIVARDEENREKERTYKDLCKNRGANKEKPKRPEDIVVQNTMPNTTNAALVQRLLDAERNGGRFLYTRMDEIELINQIKATGGASSSELIRLAFDCAKYGQERVGNDSVCGTPPLRWNWNASTTPIAGRRFFKNGLLNGTVSRLSFCTIMNPPFCKLPRFKEYNEEFGKKLKPYIQLLNTATGLITCKEADKLAETTLEMFGRMVALSGDEFVDVLSRRGNVMGFIRAMILYIAEGYVWNKKIADFVKWSIMYDMWCKVHFFGDMAQREYSQYRKELTVKKGPRNLLEVLPEEFTENDLKAVRVAQGMSENCSYQITNWLTRKFIVKSNDGYKKTGK